MKPWFEAFVGTRAGAGKDAGGGGEAKLGIPMTEKKFAKLGLSLLHLQQQCGHAGDRFGFVHPVIQRAVESVGSPFL